MWTKADILVIRTLETNLSEILWGYPNILFQENAFENVVCEMVATYFYLNVINYSQFRKCKHVINLDTAGIQVSQYESSHRSLEWNT